VDDTVLILERAFNQKKTAARDDHAVTLEDVWSKDYICDAGFVFQREKDESLGGARALARDDASGDAYGGAILAVQQVVR